MVFLLLTKEKQDPQLFPLPIPVHRSGDLAQSFLSVWGPGLRFSLVRNSISSCMSGARSQLTGCLISKNNIQRSLKVQIDSRNRHPLPADEVAVGLPAVSRTS
jgi:hypothetical protein